MSRLRELRAIFSKTNGGKKIPEPSKEAPEQLNNVHEFSFLNDIINQILLSSVSCTRFWGLKIEFIHNPMKAYRERNSRRMSIHTQKNDNCYNYYFFRIERRQLGRIVLI